MIVKPKKDSWVEIMNWRFIIFLKPQQKWMCEKVKEGYCLERDNVTMTLTEEEFEKSFREVTE